MPDSWIVFFFVIPLAGAFFAFIEKIRPTVKTARPAVILVFIVCLLLLLMSAKGIFRGETYEVFMGGWTEIVGISLYLDGLAWAGLLTMYIICALITGFAVSAKHYDASFYFFFLILLSGMAGVLLAHDLFNLFVSLEIVGTAAYILISYSRKEKAVLASFKYLILSSLGMALFLIGVFVVYMNTGTLCLGTLISHYSGTPSRSLEESLSIACLVAGIGIRSAFVPFHAWLPDAHAYAPHPVSAILSGVAIKVPFLALWRLIVMLGIGDVRILLLWTGVFTALLGVLRALVQTDCKRLLAWSSVSQMGYILAGFGAQNSLSVSGSLYHIFSHALFKSLLFLSVGSVMIHAGERSIKKISGMAREMPLATLFFSVGALSIIGIPPLNGYVSKKMILDGLNGIPAAGWILWAVSAGTAASFLKLSSIFRGSKKTSEIASSSNLGKRGFSFGNLGMGGLALLCLITGLFGPDLYRPIGILLFNQPLDSIPVFWDLKTLLDSGMAVLTGFILYFLLMSRSGIRLQEIVSRREIGFDWALILFLGGFLFYYGFIYLY